MIIEHLCEGYCIIQTTTNFAFLSISIGWFLSKVDKRFGWKMNEVLGPFVCFPKSFYLYIYIMKLLGGGKRNPTMEVLMKRERGNDHCQSIGRNSNNNKRSKGRRRPWESIGWWVCAQAVTATIRHLSLSPPPLPATPSQQSMKSYSDCSCCLC